MSSAARRYIWCKERKKMVEYFWSPPPPRVYIHGDTMPLMRNHAVNKHHPDAWLDSKSRYEKSLAANDCAVVPSNHDWSKQKEYRKDYDVKGAMERAERSLTYKNDASKDID